MYLSEEESRKAITHIHNSNYPFAYNYKKHSMVIMDEAGDEAVRLRLPLTIPPAVNSGHSSDDEQNYIILLIQSGSSALGYCEGQELLDHKVFKSYMVRKKQGKSQVKYLKTKGKSRAGSRVRLANTLNFFEDINERLQEYFEEYRIDRIALSCSKTLIPYLFNAKVPCPFDKKDERLYKIPKHIHSPGYDILLDTQAYLQQGELIYDKTHQELVNSIFGAEDNPDEGMD